MQRWDEHPTVRDEKHRLLFQIHDINVDDSAEARSSFGFIRLYDDAVVEDRDNTTPIVHEIDDNRFIKSDTIDTAAVHQGQPACCLDGMPARQDCHTAAAQQAEHR